MNDHILVVDDDAQVTSFLQRFFEKNGYRSTGVATSRQMFEILTKDDIDLVVLDLILPDEDGLDAARRLQKTSDVPIIMLSARNDVYDRIIGLELGADDYVTKPYEPRELLARVRSVLRRHRNSGTNSSSEARLEAALQIQFGQIVLNLAEATARRASDGQNLSLTNTEFELLQTIVAARGEVVTRADLVRSVYGPAADITDRAIDAHMVRLRRKLALAAPDAEVIMTVHGRGYRLAAEIAAAG